MAFGLAGPAAAAAAWVAIPPRVAALTGAMACLTVPVAIWCWSRSAHRVCRSISLGEDGIEAVRGAGIERVAWDSVAEVHLRFSPGWSRAWRFQTDRGWRVEVDVAGLSGADRRHLRRAIFRRLEGRVFQVTWLDTLLPLEE